MKPDNYLSMLLTCFVTLIVALYVVDVQTVLDPPFLLPILNSIFLAAIPFFIAFTAARLFLSTGNGSLLMLGSGILALGSGGLISGWFIGSAGGLNITITIYNSSALLCAVLLLSGEITLYFHRPWNPFKNRSRALFTIYLAVIITVGGVVYLDTAGYIPDFIVQGKGATLLGRSVLVLTVVTFGVSALLSLIQYHKSATELLRWNTTGLLLFTTGLTGVLLQKFAGSPIGWVGRCSQYAGSVCILVSVLNFWKFKASTGLSLEESISQYAKKRINELELANEQLKQAQLALEESEKLYRAVLEDQTEVIVRYLPDGTYSYVNNVFCRLFGKQPHEIFNNNWQPEIYPDDLPIVTSRLALLTADNPVVVIENRVLTSTAGVRWMQFVNRGFFDKDGKLLETQAVGRDITALKNLEHELRQKEQALEEAQLLAKSGSWVYDPVARKSTWSIGMYHVMGLDPSMGQFPFEDHQKYVHPDDYPLFLSIVKEAVEHGRPYDVKLRITRPDGVERIIKAICDPVCDACGKVIQLKGIIQDITDRKQTEDLMQRAKETAELNLQNTKHLFHELQTHQAELEIQNEELRRTQNKLEVSQDRYRSLYDHAPVGYLTLNGQSIILEANLTIAAMLGTTRADLLNISISSFILPEDQDIYYLNQNTHNETNETKNLEIRLIRNDNSFFWANLQIVHINSNEQRISLLDTNKHKLAEEALRQAHDNLEKQVIKRTLELSQANEQMKKVTFELVWAEEKERERIAGELHDRVGQSLLLAKMKLEEMANELPTPDHRMSADKICSLLGESIKDIRSLTFSMRPPLLNTANLETALKWLSSSFADDYHLKVEFSNNNVHDLLSEEYRYTLFYAIRELLLNIVKHAKTDTAQLSMYNANKMLVVQVTDNGIGFEPQHEIMKHFTGGYGLYNVRQRLEQLDGHFTVDSAPGRGTTVTLLVPNGDESE